MLFITWQDTLPNNGTVLANLQLSNEAVFLKLALFCSSEELANYLFIKYQLAVIGN